MERRKAERKVFKAGFKVGVFPKGQAWYVDIEQTTPKPRPLEYSMTSSFGRKVSLRYSGKVAKP